MPLNGSDFVDNPWNITFSAYTDLFGNAFYIVPIAFIAVALYIKTRSPIISSVWIWSSGLLMAGGNIFANNPDMAIIYGLFTAIGIAGTIISIFFMEK